MKTMRMITRLMSAGWARVSKWHDSLGGIVMRRKRRKAVILEGLLYCRHMAEVGPVTKVDKVV